MIIPIFYIDFNQNKEQLGFCFMVMQMLFKNIIYLYVKEIFEVFPTVTCPSATEKCLVEYMLCTFNLLDKNVEINSSPRSCFQQNEGIIVYFSFTFDKDMSNQITQDIYAS